MGRDSRLIAARRRVLQAAAEQTDDHHGDAIIIRACLRDYEIALIQHTMARCIASIEQLPTIEQPFEA